jgi:hypothetical protein
MNYNFRTVLIVCVAAVASFFIAQAVIPDKNVKENISEKPREERQQTPGGDIQIVVADGVPVEDPLLSPQARAIPTDTHARPPVPQTTYSGSNVQPPTVQIERQPDPEPAPPPPPPAPAPRPAPSTLKIEQAAVCAAIENKAPRNISDRFSIDQRAIYYFTHVTGARDTMAILHRWYRDGALIQTSILQIKSPSWRTHSRRNLAGAPEMAGNWRVEAIEQRTGRVLNTTLFVVE